MKIKHTTTYHLIKKVNWFTYLLMQLKVFILCNEYPLSIVNNKRTPAFQSDGYVALTSYKCRIEGTIRM